MLAKLEELNRMKIALNIILAKGAGFALLNIEQLQLTIFIFKRTRLIEATT